MMAGALRTIAGLGIFLGVLAVGVGFLPQGVRADPPGPPSPAPGDGDVLIQVETRAVVVGNPIKVTIDIKPGSHPNSINLEREGAIPVAILSSDTFDGASVDPATVTFERAAPKHWSLEHVDQAGHIDMLLHFECQAVSIEPDATEACLQGTTYEGVGIEGCDSVRIVSSDSPGVTPAVVTPVPRDTSSLASPSSRTATPDLSSVPIAPPPSGGDGAGSWKDGWPWWAVLALGGAVAAFMVASVGWTLGRKPRNRAPKP